LSSPTDPVRSTATIVNERGLHARAAAKFVKLVETFDATITVERGGMSVGGLSIMGLMMFGAGPGTELQLTATGPDAGAAMAALLDLIGRGFDEDISFTAG
jgi:phosphocarrier protein HPr